MIIRKIVLRTMLLAFIGTTIIGFLCIYELYNGSGLTHPIWDRTYNWLPLLRDILFVSFIGAILSSIASVNTVKHAPVRKTAIKGGYRYGH